MTTVWAIIPEGIYGKPPAGIFSTEELAADALIALSAENDGYHTLEVVAYELDTITEGALILKRSHTPTEEDLERWRALDPQGRNPYAAEAAADRNAWEERMDARWLARVEVVRLRLLLDRLRTEILAAKKRVRADTHIPQEPT